MRRAKVTHDLLMQPTGDVPDILIALREVEAVPSAWGACTLEWVSEYVYCLRTADGQQFFIKYLADDDRYGQNELRVNRTLLATAELATPQLLFAVDVRGGTVVCWTWATGADLRHQHRERLPEAFAQLGCFHLAHKNSECVFSPVTHEAYVSIAALLDAEWTTLSGYVGPENRALCAVAFSRLRVGFGTTIHGDMHPGNLRWSQAGFQFVDWGFALNSLNLLDLDYVHSVPGLEAEADEWWTISSAEAAAILPVYFDACGMSAVDWRPIHLAVMARSMLYARCNALNNDDAAGAGRSLRNLGLVLRCFREYA